MLTRKQNKKPKNRKKINKKGIKRKFPKKTRKMNMRGVAGNISPEPLDIYTPEERLVKAFEQVDDYYKIVELSDVIDTAYEKFQLIKEQDEKYRNAFMKAENIILTSYNNLYKNDTGLPNKELINNALIKFRESKLSPGGFAPMGE